MFIKEKGQFGFQEGLEQKRERIKQKVKEALGALEASESEVKSILDQIDSLSEHNLDRLNSINLMKFLREVLLAMRMEGGLENLEKIISRKLNTTDKDDDEDDDKDDIDEESRENNL